jgi:superfamily II DNA helicase RecQ
VRTIFLTNGKLGLNKLYLIVKGSKSKQISDFNKLSTYGKLSSLTEEQIKDIVTILKINGYLRDRSLSSGFGSVIETTSTIVTWYRNILSKTSKLEQTYDNLNPILHSYDLHLEIPSNFSSLTKIKFKSTVQELIEEFIDI